MTNLLVHQRCFNHAAREAAARCPECGHFFCRECVTEHDDRVICAACLKKLTHLPLLQRPAFNAVLQLIQCAAGIFVVWFFFYLAGQRLIELPNSFHEGTLWQMKWTDRP